MGPRTTGSEQPSTLGGPGWRPRRREHRDEVAEGLLWAPCGYRSEAARLRQVMLTRPPASLAHIADPGAHLMTERTDFGLLTAQAGAVHDAYRGFGVDVVWLAAPDGAPPNVIFARDLCFVTPEGAVLARMASQQRAGEERYAAATLAAAGIPILATPSGDATFEGADALWLDDATVMLGVGRRTNQAGAALVTRVLAAQGVTTVQVPLPDGFQHLLGAVTFVGHRAAALHGAAPPRLRAVLAHHDVTTIELPPTPEITVSRGMNLVALAPGRVLMPAGAPGVRRALAAAGIEAHVADVGEYVKAAGALGCMTAILRRDM